jgi:hypothetical protein
MSDGCSIVEFLRHDGNTPITVERPALRRVATLNELRDRYLETHTHAIETSTLKTSRLWERLKL